MIIRLHRSSLIGTLMVLTHLAALAIIFWIDLSIGFKLLLAALVLVSLVDVFRRFVLRLADNAITTMELLSNNNMLLTSKSGRSYRVSGLHSLFVNPVVTLLTVAIEDKLLPMNLVIPFDAIDHEKFRQLRVRLKKI